MLFRHLVYKASKDIKIGNKKSCRLKNRSLCLQKYNINFTIPPPPPEELQKDIENRM